MNWEEAKRLCPMGWVHGDREAELKALFEDDEPAFWGLLEGWMKRLADSEWPNLERRLIHYFLAVRGNKARENGRRVVEYIRQESGKLPPDDLPPMIRRLWFQGFIPRSRVVKEFGIKRKERAKQAHITVEDSTDEGRKLFGSDLEFKRMIDKLEAGRIIEIKHQRVPFKRSRRRGMERTFYRVIRNGEIEEGWSPEPWELLTHRQLLHTTRYVLVKEALYWLGEDDSDPYRLMSLDQALFGKIRDRVEARLVEIFGKELVERDRLDTSAEG